MQSGNRDCETSLLSDFELASKEVPDGVDRRAFLMSSALVGAVSVMTGCARTGDEAAAAQLPARQPPRMPSPAFSPELEVVKKAKGPVMTTLDEFYKVGPGPSSSHTIG